MKFKLLIIFLGLIIASDNISNQKKFFKPADMPLTKQRSKLSLLKNWTIESSKLMFNSPNDLLLIEVDELPLFYVNEENNNIVEYPFLKNDYFDALINKRIQNYNSLAKNIDMPLFIFEITNARDTNWFDKLNYLEGAGPDYHNQLIDNINTTISYNNLNFKNWQEYQLQSYKTDHHWNVFGAYRGYNQIIDILNNEFPQIGFPKKPMSTYCSNVKFYGSLTDGKEENYDMICDFEYALNNHDIFVNGIKVSEFGNREKYKTELIENDIKINHYKEIFGTDSAEVIYDYGNNTGINALIITDSYSNAIKPVLSSHFDKTVYIDLRHYLNQFGSYFDLKAYQEKYNFDVILYIGGFFTIVMDEAYLINNYFS